MFQDKPVNIPEAPRERDHMQTVPSFVRNVMGSSAGAGSGEFHVYRHLRRKEYARQKTIQAKSIKEQLDDDYQHKLEDNRRLAEEKTAKKRAKRLKKKHRGGKKPKGPRNVTTLEDDQNEEDTTDEEEAEATVLEAQEPISDEQQDTVVGETIAAQSKEDIETENKKSETEELQVDTAELLEHKKDDTTEKLETENRNELLKSENKGEDIVN